MGEHRWLDLLAIDDEQGGLLLFACLIYSQVLIDISAAVFICSVPRLFDDVDDVASLRSQQSL